MKDQLTSAVVAPDRFHYVKVALNKPTECTVYLVEECWIMRDHEMCVTKAVECFVGVNRAAARKSPTQDAGVQTSAPTRQGKPL